MKIANLKRARRLQVLAALILPALCLGSSGLGRVAHAQNSASTSSLTPPAPLTLPPLPANLPSWLHNRDTNHVFRRRGSYNDAVYNIPALARDLNAVAVGHSLAYEDLVTGRAAQLETQTYARVRGVLGNPPRLMPDEKFLSPSFARRYGVLEQVFDWTHILHAQTVDVLASTSLSEAEKEREIEALWRFYQSQPHAISGLPFNMAFLDGQPYSGAFRRQYPRVNGLFWGYHWLQGAMYDVLWGQSLEQQKRLYEVVGRRYHQAELLRTNRPFMPMFAELSPRFAARFPLLANAFDNLHMLHDMVNDILATPGLSELQREQQITRAIWLVSQSAHQGEQPGQDGGAGGLHDHRFMIGMPGMGLMKGGTTQVMPMNNGTGASWMSMSDCHHCSMALPGVVPGRGEAWQSSTVSAEGWTMRVRCAMCARDMSAQIKGEAILRIPTEDPRRPLLVVSNERGELSTDTPGVVFIEEPASHARCNAWSRAFTSRAAFEEYAKANPSYKNARALSFAQWSQLEGEEPDTYVRPEAPATQSAQSATQSDALQVLAALKAHEKPTPGIKPATKQGAKPCCAPRA